MRLALRKLLPPALGYIGWLVVTGQSHFLVGVPTDTVLLFGCGLVTAVPLILYANGNDWFGWGKR